MDYCRGPPDAQLAAPSQRDLKTVPILRMYGITAAGNSVCGFLHGFEPYFYCQPAARVQITPDDVGTFQETLNVRSCPLSALAWHPVLLP